ncbi:MAG TPA: MBL fold metallo-hydrolase [Puia sp.]|nr:MBL fold metallo-hydrolase [Puia sp.]
MLRRKFLQQSSLALGALSLPGHSSTFYRLAQEPWKMRMLRGNVGIFYEKGGTIAYLLSPAGIVVVDAEFPEQAGHLIEQLKKQSDKPFQLLINTHHHGDHTGGNIAFKGIVNHVAAHTNSLSNQQRVAATRHTEAQQLYPDTTYGDNWEFPIGDERIQTAYFGAAHTDGDSIIHFTRANVAHLGDLLFNRMWPFIDRTAGASVNNWIAVLDKALKKYDNDTIFVFGHAFDPDKVTGNKNDLLAMRDMFSRLMDFVGTQIRAGKTREDILKATAIPGVTEWQGNGIAGSLQAAYEELTAGAKA